MPLQNTSFEQIGSGNTATIQCRGQGAQAAYTAAAAPLLVADLITRIITYNAGGGNNLQLPLAADLDTALPNFPINSSFDFSVVALGAGTATVTTNTGWTLVGSMAVAQNIAMLYRARKTAAGAWTLYQVS